MIKNVLLHGFKNGKSDSNNFKITPKYGLNKVEVMNILTKSQICIRSIKQQTDRRKRTQFVIDCLAFHD